MPTLPTTLTILSRSNVVCLSIHAAMGYNGAKICWLERLVHFSSSLPLNYGETLPTLRYYRE